MKKASAKATKSKNTKKRSATIQRGFLPSGCDWKMMFQMFFAGVGLLTALVSGVYYHEHYLVVVPEGVIFQGQDVSGLNRPQVIAMVEHARNRYEEQALQIGIEPVAEEVSLEFHGSAEETQNLSAKEWGVNVDVSETVDDFFQISDRYGQADVFSASEANKKKIVIPRLVLRDPERVLTWIHDHERELEDARLIFDEGSRQWVLSPDRYGLRYPDEERKQLEEQLKSVLLEDQPVKKLTVKLERLPAAVKTADLIPLYDQIQAMTLPKVSWGSDGQTSIFSLKDHQHMIAVDVEGDKVGLDEGLLSDFVQEIATSVDREAGAVLANEAVQQDKGYSRSSYAGHFEHGRVLDQALLFENILTALHSEALETTVELKFSEENPTVVLAGAGTLTLLAKGMSSYALGNLPDRIFNVKFGLSKYDGVVIQPGEEFSFNQKLGIVSYDAGWKPALAIFGGGGLRKVPGGGLCQVSTTMYRAAILAGLPITKRKPHSLDVSYYHEGGYGIDATIYPPANLDLKFVNDTGGPIFIHAYTDDLNTRAYVEFYGISDGREVELKPKANFRLSAEKGGGRYISWNWNITRADGTVDERMIETYYPGAH